MLKWTAFVLMSLSLTGMIVTAVAVIRRLGPILYIFLS